MINKMNSILKDFLQEDNIEITENTLISSELGINSFQFAELICVLEDEFCVEIPDHVIGNFVTIKDIVDYIQENVGKEGNTWS